MRKFVILLSIVLLLSGCANIPTAGPIRFGQEIQAVDTNQFIQVIGRPPIDGMTQEQIVRGFLSALADSRDNYAIAKQYLTAETAQSWKSDGLVTIYENNSLTVELENEQAIATMSKFGSLDNAGHLEIVSAGMQISQVFSLVRNAQDEWRITNLADGVLLSVNDVERSFNGYPAYFLSSDRRRLVPDTVLLPQVISGSATSLVQSLLDGPSNKLSTAVLNAFPAGTRLTYGSVPVVDGLATVDLTNQVLSADQPTRALMSAQLVWTLSSLPNVNSVEIRVSGQPLSVTGAQLEQSTRDWSEFNPAQFSGGELVHFVKDNQVFSIGLDGEITPVVQLDPTANFSLGVAFGAADGSGIAALSADNKEVLISTGGGGQFRSVATGESISRPSWDRQGNIFYSDYGVGLFKVTSDGESSAVIFEENGFANSTQVKQISIAKDGVRVALAISSGSADFLLVGSIVETETSTRIVGLRLVERTITLIQDIAWQTPTSIAVLGSDNSGGNLIFDVDLTVGTSTISTAPLSAKTIASSLGKQMYVGTVSGAKLTIARQSGPTWTDIAEGASPYLAE